MYTSKERALRYVESPDVDDGEYTAVFDSEGLRLRLVVSEPTKRKKGWFFTSIELGVVVLEQLEEEPSGSEELHSILASKLPDCPPGAGLESLVKRAVNELPSP